MNEFVIPPNFIPYDKLIICDNELIYCKALIKHKDFYPILIGKGIYPKIWIYSKYRKYTIIKNVPIVEQSISRIRELKLDIDSDKHIISIKNIGSENNTILRMSYFEDLVNIDTIDLRPIGYDIYGTTEKGLTAGGNTYKGNKMENLEAMFIIR